MSNSTETLHPAEESYDSAAELLQPDQNDLARLSSETPLTILDILGMPREAFDIPDTRQTIVATLCSTNTGGDGV